MTRVSFLFELTEVRNRWEKELGIGICQIFNIKYFSKELTPLQSFIDCYSSSLDQKLCSKILQQFQLETQTEASQVKHYGKFQLRTLSDSPPNWALTKIPAQDVRLGWKFQLETQPNTSQPTF